MKIKNIVGNRFGFLTVTKLAGRNSSKHLLWECVCECGNTSVHTGNNLRNGTTKSCGCKKRRSQRKSLLGNKYGRLEVVSEGKTENGVAFWKCKCDCGNQAEVSTGHLTTYHTKSCGCLSSEVSRKLAYKNIAGKKRIALNGTLANRKTQEGYVKIHDRKHPRADGGGFVFEHLVVMEKKLGRFLWPKENVHHINGIRDDNSPDNLELWTRSQPPGQRVIDRLSHAVEFIAAYEKDNMPLDASIEDLRKAAWYVDREIQKRQREIG